MISLVGLRYWGIWAQTSPLPNTHIKTASIGYRPELVCDFGDWVLEVVQCRDIAIVIPTFRHCANDPLVIARRHAHYSFFLIHDSKPVVLQANKLCVAFYKTRRLSSEFWFGNVHLANHFFSTNNTA